MSAAALVSALGLAAAVLVPLLLARRRWCVVTVTGLSMEPTLRHGDRVLVRRRPLGAVRAGQVVVLTGPDGNRQDWLVKRAVAVPGDPVPRATVAALAGSRDRVVPAGRLVVLGDNPALSLDSRRLGYLPGARLVGVVFRTLPGRAPPETPAASAAGRRAGTVPAAATEGDTT